MSTPDRNENAARKSGMRFRCFHFAWRWTRLLARASGVEHHVVLRWMLNASVRQPSERGVAGQGIGRR
jgi:hypothetical protein